MEQWAQDFIDLVSPGRIAHKNGGAGGLHFGCVRADLDWRYDADTRRVEFIFAGFDEGDEVSGRGWAKAQGNNLSDRIVFHRDEASDFAATRATEEA